MSQRQLLTSTLLFALLFSMMGCSKKEQQAEKTSTGTVVMEKQQGAPRPSASLGMFVGYFLGGGSLPRNVTALNGVEAQLRLHAQYNPMAGDETQLLLEEFGNILQIDIVELLNRSPDRPTTLTEYTEALQNITTRSQKTSEDLTTYLAALQKQDKQERAAVSDLKKRYDKANKSGDFATMGALQQELSNAQVKESGTQASIGSTKGMLSAYKDLLEVATLRLDAMNRNREILISGLKVVDVPGIKDLGLIEEQIKKKR